MVDRSNNFDMLRLILSLVVFFYHSEIILGISLPFVFSGEFALKCFFVISGYLIVKSYVHSKSIKRYFVSRFFRVYPLYFLLIFITCILSIIYIYIQDFELCWQSIFKYFFFNSIFANFIYPGIPPVFDGNLNFPSIINGSLWTLKVEVAFYILVPLLFKFAVNKSQYIFITICVFLFSCLSGHLISYFVSYFYLPSQLNNQLPSLLVYFMGGAIFNFITVGKKVFFSMFFVSFLLLLVLKLPEPLESVFISIFVMYLAVGTRFTISIPHTVGDLSFFVYLFHFPLLQTLSFYSVDYGAYNILSFALLLCLLFAWFSWHFFEKPLLRYVKSKL